MPSDNRLGVLLLSAARHQSTFAGIFAAHPALRLIAVADEPGEPDWIVDQNRRLAAEWRLPYTEDVAGALDDPAVRVVSICPEYARHHRLAVQALGAGKHVLLDKQPLGMTLAEGQAVATAAADAATRGIKFTYIHHCLDTGIQRLRRLVESGRIGQPRAVHCEMIASYGPGDDPDVSPTGRYGRGYHPRWWQHGELMHFGGYAIGAARYLMMSEISAVHATLGTHFNRFHREHRLEDLAVLSLRFANGGLGTVAIGRAPNRAHPAAGDLYSTIVGSHGSAVADWEEQPVLVADPGVGGSQRVTVGRDAGQLVIGQFVEAILSDRRPLLDHVDGLAELRALLAGYESASRNQSIALD